MKNTITVTAERVSCNDCGCLGRRPATSRLVHLQSCGTPTAQWYEPHLCQECGSCIIRDNIDKPGWPYTGALGPGYCAASDGAHNCGWGRRSEP